MGSRITRQELENGIAAINRKIGFIRSHLLSETDATMKMLYRDDAVALEYVRDQVLEEIKTGSITGSQNLRLFIGTLEYPPREEIPASIYNWIFGTKENS